MQHVYVQKIRFSTDSLALRGPAANQIKSMSRRPSVYLVISPLPISKTVNCTVLKISLFRSLPLLNLPISCPVCTVVFLGCKLFLSSAISLQDSFLLARDHSFFSHAPTTASTSFLNSLCSWHCFKKTLYLTSNNPFNVSSLLGRTAFPGLLILSMMFHSSSP